MEQRTYLSNQLEVTGEKAEYDAEAKKLVADKTILAWILRDTVEEVKGLRLAAIKACIEDVQVSEVPVVGGNSGNPAQNGARSNGAVSDNIPVQENAPESIIGMNTEDAVPGEGKAIFDVRFYILTQGKRRVRILLNIEIQKSAHPGYDVVTRGIFYACRMISAQKDTEFSGDDFDSMKKVYSIWLCLNTSGKEADTITSYRLVPKFIAGKMDGKTLPGHRYDLLNVTMVGLNEKSYKEKVTRLHGFLGTIFSGQLKPNEKIQILNDEYGVKPTRQVTGRIGKMCNLSDAIEERGIQRGIQEMLIGMVMKKIKKDRSLEEICEDLDESEESIRPIYDAVRSAGDKCSVSDIYQVLYGK